MATVVLDGLDEALLLAVRQVFREELAEQQQSEPASPWLDVPRAAEYLCTTPAAIRSLKKRREIPFHQAPNGRVLFRREELDAWVTGDE